MLEFIRRQFHNGNAAALLTIAVMVGLFISSSQTYTQQSQVSRLALTGWFDDGKPLANFVDHINLSWGGELINVQVWPRVHVFEFLLRKAAHFLTYALLGGAAFIAIRQKVQVKRRICAAAALAIAALYACSDEFHQLLTGDRTPSWHDVALDSVGALTAIAFVAIFAIPRRRT